METMFLTDSKEDIQSAAKILQNGGLCAIPTETVYGLAANALDSDAVKEIFSAKGRPQDNPLIVHISDMSQLDSLVEEIPASAQKLMEAFWPGPLTIIMKRSANVPPEVSCGLSTVAIRFPAHPVAQKIIEACGFPLAAPSANRSGAPSPTTALHVIGDLNGRIDAIIDGGDCEVGLESTVVTVADGEVRLLRPGKITPEQIKAVTGSVQIDRNIKNKLDENAVVASPGMKYKHYAPDARIIIIKSDFEKFLGYVETHSDETTAVLCFDGEQNAVSSVPCICYGHEDDSSEQAQRLFSALHEINRAGYKTVYSRCPSEEGVGLAVYNRLIRAAGFEVIEL